MINQKAQTLTELATFGAILLLVLSFFISYGMRYNYQQDAQMRAFRMAMSEAYKSDRPDASAAITLVEDKHVPDPRDTFGVGNIVPAQANAEATWGNTMQDEYTDDTDSSRVKYMINGLPKEYTIEGTTTISNAAYSGFYADILGSRQYIVWANAKCYQPAPDSPKRAIVLLDGNETEIINAIYLPAFFSGLEKIEEISLPIVGVIPSTAGNGDPINGFIVRTPRKGEINPNYTQLNQNTGDFDLSGNPVKVTPENIQGLSPFDTNTTIKRADSLKLEEASGTSGYRKSTSNYNLNATITRKIGKNSIISPSETITSPPVIIEGKDKIY